MKKIYYLKSCSTCQKILKQIPNVSEFELQDIKTQALTEAQLSELVRLSGSFERLLSRKATLYKERGLKDVSLTELDIKNLLLEHYTFLARPVVLVDSQIFIGNSAANIAALVAHLS